MKRKCKYSRMAGVRRYCEMPNCNKRLNRDEVILCSNCYEEKIRGMIKEEN